MGCALTARLPNSTQSKMERAKKTTISRAIIAIKWRIDLYIASAINCPA
jgi:hypothetical protein